MGSGTTSKMCILNNRNYIGSELSSEYCEIERKRLESVLNEKSNSNKD
jgi:site-specific DNA-methyltransferase (adenine-specific)